MPVRKWHVGKLVLLWVWGVVLGGLVLTSFQSSSVASSPGLHLCELIFVIVIAVILSAITWIWLGDRKPEAGPDSR